MRILATTDLHGYLAAYDYYRDGPSDRLGLAKLATLIRQARAETPNTMLFDNGDLIAGNPLCDYVMREKGLKPGDTHPVYKAMNLLGYDAATMGNHDFNNGLPFLERAISGASFPYVCANVLHANTDTPYFRPFVILDRNVTTGGGASRSLRIGVMGVTPPQVSIWARHQTEGRIATSDIVDTVTRYVAEMKKAGAELIVVLAHTGMGNPPHRDGEEDAAYAVSQIDGVDVTIAGHDHRVFPDAHYANLPGYDPSSGTLNGKPAVMAGFYGSHLGIVDLKLAEGTDGKLAIVQSRGSTRPLHEAGVAPDDDVMQAIEADHRATLAYIRRPVGRLAIPLTSYFDLVAPSALLKLIATVQIWAAEQARQDEPELFAEKADLPMLAAVAPFKAGKRRAGPGTYTDIPAGDLAMGHVADLYAYPNLLYLLEMDGAGVREWLEMSAAIFQQIHPDRTRAQNLIRHDFPVFDFDVMHGVTYGIDVTQPARYRKGGDLADTDAHRIVDLRFQGKPVVDSDRFLVATNNYRAGGGGSFPGLDGREAVFKSPDTMQDTIVAWFRAQSGPIDPSTMPDPWRFANLPDSASVIFETSPDAAACIPQGRGIAYIGETEDGFGKFSVAAS